MWTEPKTRISLGWFLAFAVVLHLIFINIRWSGLSNLQSPISQLSSPIEIESFPQEKRKPVVQTSKSNEEELSSESAQFAGEFKNRVKKETQSQLTGPFQEGKVGGGKDEPTSEEGDFAMPQEKGPNFSELMVMGRSPHFLSDKIEKGNQTILNTDKVLYASFINRIAEEVYQPWVRNISESLKQIGALGKKLENNIYVTKLNVSMDKRGEITGIQVLSSSGVQAIDEAPKRAFWEVEPFPNPPMQLIEEDGYIRLVYEFHFEWKSSGFNIVPMTI
ncbi:MAG: hypothetical protein EBR01_05265 [Proteobacteria bacterium]|nr:hypothetical protein [Pseudomonadota bacterium]